MRPHIWEALKYQSANYMHHLEEFVLSEGDRYQDLQLAANDVIPRQASNAPPDGLDGWSYMMRTPEKDLALLYFENKSYSSVLRGFLPMRKYMWQWFDPESGDWEEAVMLETTKKGNLTVPDFPDRGDRIFNDWAAKIILE